MSQIVSPTGGPTLQVPRTHSCDPDVSTTGITINRRHSCDRHSTWWAPLHSCVLFCFALLCSLIAVLRLSHSCERMLCALLFIVLQLCSPTSRIHSWGLQHTPARTYCSPSSCMRSKSQLWLPCQLISIILLAISSSFIRLLIDEQWGLPCRISVLYCPRLAFLSLCCSLMSSCDFHVLVLLLTVSSSFIILLIDEQLRLPCLLISL
jgi:hypothetical protein